MWFLITPIHMVLKIRIFFSTVVRVIVVVVCSLLFLTLENPCRRMISGNGPPMSSEWRRTNELGTKIWRFDNWWWFTLVRTSGVCGRQAMMTQGLSITLCETIRINTTICVWAVVTDTHRPCNAHPMFLSACVCWRRIRSHTPDLKHGEQLHVCHIIMSNASDWRVRT